MTITNKNYKRSQQGRSMVEMLGVLAIVGTLSVGGVYGYGVAMKKHKANELLHRASMLASTVSAQIMSGKDPTTLDTFADSNLGKFTLDYDSTKTTFDLKISELDGSICNQLKKGGMVQKVECNETAKTASITYYKNLATDPAEGEKIPTGGSNIDTGMCANGNVYLSYNVGAECDTTTPKNMGCTKNSDCASAEKCSAGAGKCYCKIEGDYDLDTECSGITGGTCETLDAGTETTYENGSNKKTFLKGPDQTWWAAENWCKAHHKSLVSYSTLNSLFGCDKDEANDYDSPSCTWSKFTTSSNWSNGTLSDYYWTAESDGSCDAWGVGVYVSDFMFYGTARHDYLYALCE